MSIVHREFRCHCHFVVVALDQMDVNKITASTTNVLLMMIRRVIESRTGEKNKKEEWEHKCGESDVIESLVIFMSFSILIKAEQSKRIERECISIGWEWKEEFCGILWFCVSVSVSSVSAWEQKMKLNDLWERRKNSFKCFQMIWCWTDSVCCDAPIYFLLHYFLPLSLLKLFVCLAFFCV